jgi:transglutaminase-like putative cysteine protease
VIRSEKFPSRPTFGRDYAHLAVAFCRCLNIPARYCTGYLGDIGTPPPYGPMDFAAWFEAYLGGRAKIAFAISTPNCNRMS